MTAYKPLPTLSQAQKDAYVRDGYVFVPGLIDDSQLPTLREACDRVVAKTRAGEWPHRRIHIMHPDLHEPIFARWYGSEGIVGAATSLLGCEENQVQMELFNLLINPDRHAFALRWHRDDVPETAGLEEEIAALKTNFYGVQWNTALYDDACLFVVPGSHREPRTPEQRALSSTQEAPKDPMDMPGAICVKLKAGDTVFYQNNILHTAAYYPDVKRATLHASMGDIRGGSRRARMILQHKVDWIRGDAFTSTFQSEGSSNDDAVATRLRGMLDRLLTMADAVKGQDLEYSQQG